MRRHYLEFARLDATKPTLSSQRARAAYCAIPVPAAVVVHALKALKYKKSKKSERPVSFQQGNERRVELALVRTPADATLHNPLC